MRSAKAISTITLFTLNHSLTELTLDALMFGSSHFKRGLWASRLMPYQIKGEVVKINAVQRQLCFPLECSEWQSFYVGEKAFPHVFKYDENAPGTDCHGCLLYGFKNTSLLSGCGRGNEAWHYFDSENTMRTGPALMIIVALKRLPCEDGKLDRWQRRVFTEGSMTSSGVTSVIFLPS